MARIGLIDPMGSWFAAADPSSPGHGPLCPQRQRRRGSGARATRFQTVFRPKGFPRGAQSMAGEASGTWNTAIGICDRSKGAIRIRCRVMDTAILNSEVLSSLRCRHLANANSWQHRTRAASTPDAPETGSLREQRLWRAIDNNPESHFYSGFQKSDTLLRTGRKLKITTST